MGKIPAWMVDLVIIIKVFVNMLFFYRIISSYSIEFSNEIQWIQTECSTKNNRENKIRYIFPLASLKWANALAKYCFRFEMLFIWYDWFFIMGLVVSIPSKNAHNNNSKSIEMYEQYTLRRTKKCEQKPQHYFDSIWLHEKERPYVQYLSMIQWLCFNEEKKKTIHRKWAA